MASFYTPPVGKCTECDAYIGTPSTGKENKEGVGHGEILDGQYYCPECSGTTPWERLILSEMSDSELEAAVRDRKLSEDAVRRFGNRVDDELITEYTFDYE